jgi:hypothetical protein
LAALGLSVLAASAQAGFTTIGPPNYGNGGEATQAEILSNSYGGTFSSSGLDFTNGTLTATRLDDSTDTSAPTGITSIKTLATFARYSQGLGYGDVNSPTQLFNVTGDGFAATGTSGAVDLPAGTSFVRTGDGFNQSSKDSENKDGQDHLVTYLLTGSGVTGTTYVLFWEDKTTQQHSDFDFNDLAVEVKVGSPVVVPLPAAAWSGLATLLGGGLIAGYRKARRQTV